MVNGVNADAALASPIGSCYTRLMTYNAILIIECLVEDFGWDAVMDELMKEAATASDERLDEVEELLDAAITVNEGKGQLFVLLSANVAVTLLSMRADIAVTLR